jgi:hypothetical protein
MREWTRLKPNQCRGESSSPVHARGGRLWARSGRGGGGQGGDAEEGKREVANGRAIYYNSEAGGATGDGTVTARSFSAIASASKITTALLLFSLDCDNQQ